MSNEAHRTTVDRMYGYMSRVETSKFVTRSESRANITKFLSESMRLVPSIHIVSNDVSIECLKN